MRKRKSAAKAKPKAEATEADFEVLRPPRSHNLDRDELALEAAARFQLDPQRWAEFAWDWGHGDLVDAPGPRAWQAEINEVIRRHLADPKTRYMPCQIAVASGHGIGKAHPKDMMLHTPDGLRRWGDLQVGDLVFGHQGYAVKITHVHQRGALEVFRVTLDDGSSTLCCGDHLWSVKGRNERRTGADYVTLSTAEIVRRGVVRCNGTKKAKQWQLPLHDAVEFGPRDYPVRPYTLGVWLGDGGRNSGRITSADSDVIERLVTVGERVSPNVGYAYTILGLHKKLRGLGIADRYSYQKSVPIDYLEAPAHVRAEVLRGLLDTDGECTSSGSVIFNSCSRALAEDVIWLARSLGGKARMHPTAKAPFYRDRSGVRIDCRPCYRATLSMPSGFKLFYVKRKQARVTDVEARYRHRWIASIESVGEADSMCITVDAPSSLYLANDFIVTHNSAEMGQIANWAMSCFKEARVVVTANTATQMKTKTVPEFMKWFRGSMTGHWFDLQSTRFSVRDPKFKNSWTLDFVPWSEHNTEAFAGLHNKDRIIVLLFDEGSKIADKVWEVAEGALTDENTIIIWIVFGNPTRNSGRFRECFRRFRERWFTFQIDSRTVPGATNLAKIAQWVTDYGEDSDFVKVRVRGQFPSQSARQFIGAEDADKGRASMRSLKPEMFSYAPVILGVDPAWTGDDSLEVYLRQGLYSKHLRSIPRNDDDVAMANMIANLEDEYQADGVVVDAGFGTGIVSCGRALGRTWHLVWFANQETPDPGCLNMRSFIWREMRDWLKAGGAIDPADQVLYDDIIGPETVPRLDGKIQLEAKEDMKDRGLPSPNRADALALTFAVPFKKKAPRSAPGQRRGHAVDYNPFQGM